MNKIFYFGLIVVSLISNNALSASLEKKESCRLSVAKNMMDKSNQHIIELNNSEISASVAIYGSTFFAPFSLASIPTINNKSGRTIHVSYHSLFYGKDGALLSSISQENTLKPTEHHMQYSSSIIHISKINFKSISQCEVVFQIWE